MGEFQAYTYDGFRKLKAKLLTGEDIAPVREQNREAQGLYAMASIRDEAGRSHGYMTVVLSDDTGRTGFSDPYYLRPAAYYGSPGGSAHPDGAAYPHQAGEPADGCGGELCAAAQGDCAGRVYRAGGLRRGQPLLWDRANAGGSECLR